MRALILGLLAAILIGCADQQLITQTRQIVVMPPETLFECDLVELPESRSLTDNQVARLLVELRRMNITCRNNIQAIRTVLEDAKRTIESP